MLRVKEICKKKGITFAELAKRIGVSPSAITQSISGNPSLDKITEIASALGVHIAELFEDEPTKVSGYIEINGIITKISSVSDLEDVLKEAKNI